MQGWAYRWLACSTVAAVGLLTTTTARADILLLQNDSFVDGDAVAFQGGFVAGEMGASTLGPVSDTFVVRKVQFLFGPDDTQHTITLRVYEDSGAAEPGAELFSADYQVQPSSSAMHEIDLSGDNVVHSGAGRIRVAIEVQHSDAPSIARDADGLTPNVNWIRESSLGWVSSSLFQVPGDWVIRAEVDTQGGTGGSGTGGSATGGAGTGGAGTGATGAGAPMVCVPGRSETCFGPGACEGGQVCLPDGSGYGSCECGSGGQAPGAATTASDDSGCSYAPARRRPIDAPTGLLAAGLVALAARRRRQQ